MDEMGTFDPTKFIDRVAEQEIFEGLLQFKDDARLLAIQDESGKGKSTLLRRLEYNCQWRLDCPVVLIALDQLKEASAFGLVANIRERLRGDLRFDLPFPNYDFLNLARANKKEEAFALAARSTPTVQGTVSAQGASITGSGFTVAGTVNTTTINATTVNMAGSKEWGIEQETLALHQCILAFFEDFIAICKDRPVALLLDAWEGCNSALKPWILNTLLGVYCFNLERRPQKLVVVLAGREKSGMDFKAYLGEDRCDKLVKSISSLGAWELEHVKQFLAVNDLAGIDDSDADYICKKLKQGWSLQKALNYVQEYLRNVEKAS